MTAQTQDQKEDQGKKRVYNVYGSTSVAFGQVCREVFCDVFEDGEKVGHFTSGDGYGNLESFIKYAAMAVARKFPVPDDRRWDVTSDFKRYVENQGGNIPVFYREMDRLYGMDQVRFMDQLKEYSREQKTADSNDKN